MNSQHHSAVERRPGYLARSSLQTLFTVLSQSGYKILGPRVRDGAIQFEPLDGPDALPVGVTNDQQPGHYRLNHGESQRLFDWNHGPQGLKPLCFAPREVLWQEIADPFTFNRTLPEVKHTAVLGVRACDLAALSILDHHFELEMRPDPHYKERRESLLLIGVDCAHSASTCFCLSTGDGPALDGGYDIGMAELEEGFLIWHLSTKGEAITSQLALQAADDAQLEAMLQATDQAASEQQRQLPGSEALQQLYKRLDHAQWDQVAERCLSCGNCTAVCPTCFCYQVGHEVALTGDVAEMVRNWDSCFSPTHIDMGHFQVRSNIKHRYRQWMTHKLAGWQVQQRRIGCTGCGRCITWCPVGIDLTQEVTAVLEEDSLDV
ncbi:MAG: sulfite reductase subunit A [gamma proteobacterium symbiont of Ctena orbiculata]|nr:MAG: sulfite reductase subunit A [gamma proteobacterium symbiont of Ctena orbiculata]